MQEHLLETLACPNCYNTSYRKHGKDSGSQRYLCKTCRKTFKATTGTPVHWLQKKHLIDKYIQSIEKGHSIRKAAREVGIATSTSFAWRHKLLASLSVLPETRYTNAVSGLKLIKQGYSAKGRRKQAEKCQLPTKSLLVYQSNHLKLIKLDSQKPVMSLVKLLKEHYTRSTLYSKPDRIINNAIKHTQSKKLSEKIIKEKVNGRILCCCNRLIQWMKRFRGVASKYLQQYWNWYIAQHQFQFYDKQQITELYTATRSSFELYKKLKAQ